MHVSTPPSKNELDVYSSEYLVWAYRFSGVGSDARWWGRGNLTHESVTFDQISRFALGQALAASVEARTTWSFSLRRFADSHDIT